MAIIAIIYKRWESSWILVGRWGLSSPGLTHPYSPALGASFYVQPARQLTKTKNRIRALCREDHDRDSRPRSLSGRHQHHMRGAFGCRSTHSGPPAASPVVALTFGKRLSAECKRLGSATYCLAEWAEA